MDPVLRLLIETEIAAAIRSSPRTRVQRDFAAPAEIGIGAWRRFLLEHALLKEVQLPVRTATVTLAPSETSYFTSDNDGKTWRRITWAEDRKSVV